MKIKNKLLMGAAVLSVGGFIAKILGAFYRIPLTNVLGAEGIGLYQAVFPLYCLLLTASSTGAPSGISKLISNNSDDENYAYYILKSALKIFIPLGIAGSFTMFAFSKLIAEFQGESGARLSYAAISPSVFLVSVICCFRGFFQGKSDMKPTAVSQIIEQSVKLMVGLALCYFTGSEIYVKSSYAALAVTLSEVAACVYLAALFKKRNYSFKKLKSFDSDVGGIIKVVFPIMLATVAVPVGRTVESFFILNILGGYTSNATALYGLYSGAVESMVGVPVAVCYAVATASIPVISEAASKNQNYIKNVSRALAYTVAGGVAFAVGFIIFSERAVGLLYPKLSEQNAAITVNMLKLSAASVIALPIMQTSSAALIASGNYYIPPITASVGVTVKLITSVILLSSPKINIFGAVISDILCYFVASIANLVYIYICNCKRKEFIKLQKIQNA